MDVGILDKVIDGIMILSDIKLIRIKYIES